MAETLVLSALKDRTACISFQVIQETLNVITRKIEVSLSPDEARRFLDQVLVPLWRTTPSQALYHRGLYLQSRYGYGLYDALIIAAALDSGCSRLYSEHLQDGQEIQGLTMTDPFKQRRQ